MEKMQQVIAQLRHAYAQLAAGTVIDQKSFADGMISPQIKYLESVLDEATKQEEACERLIEKCLNPKPPTKALIDLMSNHRAGVASGRITYK